APSTTVAAAARASARRSAGERDDCGQERSSRAGRKSSAAYENQLIDRSAVNPPISVSASAPYSKNVSPRGRRASRTSATAAVAKNGRPTAVGNVGGAHSR